MFRTTDGWISQFKERGALWLHDGNSKRPHALLTSGMHSDGFFNSELVMEDSIFLNNACSYLVELLQQDNLDLSSVDRVVGPAMGAITLANDISRNLGLRRSRSCLRAYVEKEMDGNKKIMVFKKTLIRSKERILIVEDVLTTGGSVELTAAAITKAGGTVLPFVAVLVNRSNLTEVGGRKIIALINRPMPMWTPKKCPLCKKGSEAIRPKGTKNWNRLNTSY
ncbi:hypothetical protein COB87_002910 [Candidatus Wolfebacteria bacterium]|nr:hypothetical protein [Candidatus Wolfebacteria bacterium]